MNKAEIEDILHHRIGYTIFVDYYWEFKNQDISNEDLVNMLPNDLTLNSRKTRVRNSRKLFDLGLNILALEIIKESENSQIQETIEKAANIYNKEVG
jgi:hypothetical protein